MKWTIDKSFDFCYGHRVWSQQLDTRLTSNGDGCLACRHLHGHQGKVKIFLEAESLTDGMVTDFKHLGFMKDFIDSVLDHKLIMDINDPINRFEFPELIHSFEEGISKDYLDLKPEGHYLVSTDVLEFIGSHSVHALYEKYEGLVFVDFVPTSENLTTWLLSIAQEKLKDMSVKVVAAEYWETPKSHCRVEAS